MKSYKRFVTLAAKAVFLSLSTIVLLLGAKSDARAQTPIPSGDISPSTWDPITNSWINGNAKGFSTGETAPMAVKLTPGSTDPYMLAACLQVIEIQSGQDYFAFINVDNWDRTVLPITLPDGSSTLSANFSDTVGEFTAVNADLLSVSAAKYVGAVPAPGDLCGARHIEVHVAFQSLDAAQPSYIFFGGTFAQEGDDTSHLVDPNDTLDNPVPANRTGAFINGVFQTRISGAGDKTINFKGTDISVIPGIVLHKFISPDGINCPFPGGLETISVSSGSTVRFCFVIENTRVTSIDKCDFKRLDFGGRPYFRASGIKRSGF